MYIILLITGIITVILMIHTRKGTEHQKVQKSMNSQVHAMKWSDKETD